VIQVLEPLAELPGVQLVMLVTADGVPIAVPGRQASREERDALADSCREDVLAALSVGWFREIGSAVAPLSWDEPVRATLVGTRGVLIVSQARNSLLVVLLSRGTSPEDVQIAIDGTIRRIERNARGSAAAESTNANANPQTQPPSPLPSKNGNRPERGLADTSQQGHGQREDFSGR
jgi:predicted regulator of Ras-like GTPase activity (Roadblock/LC7/MglB family)